MFMLGAGAAAAAGAAAGGAVAAHRARKEMDNLFGGEDDERAERRAQRVTDRMVRLPQELTASRVCERGKATQQEREMREAKGTFLGLTFLPLLCKHTKREDDLSVGAHNTKRA